MSCSNPISWEELVAYWAHDLAPAEVDRIDLHLMGCASCSAESARVHALADALGSYLPPVVTREVVDRLRARGARIEENAFTPGLGKTVVFTRDLDVLVHRLAGIDLSSTQRVRFIARGVGTGDVVLEDPDAPFDPHEGILLTCQRHYAGMPAVVFEVRAIDASGVEQVAAYTIPHVFED